MTNDPLRIVSTEKTGIEAANKRSKPIFRKQETQAKFERLWLVDPENFNPLRNCMERERLDRTLALLKEFMNPSDKLIVDLGCGAGVFASRLTDEGAEVHAVDIASNALKILKNEFPKVAQAIQDYVPKTILRDDAYDLVLAMELIAYLDPDDYRLFFSELSRLVKFKGYVIVSTSLDIDSEDALQKFASLAETEFKIEKWVFSYHRFYIRCCDFIEAPERFVKASQDIEYKKRELSQRYSASHWWFNLNSKKLPSLFWKMVSLISKPIASFFKKNRSLMLGMEKICRFIWSDSGITHAILIAARRPLIVHPAAEELPRERKHKREVWE